MLKTSKLDKCCCALSTDAVNCEAGAPMRTVLIVAMCIPLMLATGCNGGRQGADIRLVTALPDGFKSLEPPEENLLIGAVWNPVFRRTDGKGADIKNIVSNRSGSYSASDTDKLKVGAEIPLKGYFKAKAGFELQSGEELTVTDLRYVGVASVKLLGPNSEGPDPGKTYLFDGYVVGALSFKGNARRQAEFKLAIEKARLPFDASIDVGGSQTRAQSQENKNVFVAIRTMRITTTTGDPDAVIGNIEAADEPKQLVDFPSSGKTEPFIAREYRIEFVPGVSDSDPPCFGKLVISTRKVGKHSAAREVHVCGTKPYRVDPITFDRDLMADGEYVEDELRIEGLAFDSTRTRMSAGKLTLSRTKFKLSFE